LHTRTNGSTNGCARQKRMAARCVFCYLCIRIHTHLLYSMCSKSAGVPAIQAWRTLLRFIHNTFPTQHSHTRTPECMQIQDAVKDFAGEKNRLASVRAVRHHAQYLAQLKAMGEGRGISLVSDTGMGAIMKAVLVGCVSEHTHVSRTHTHTHAHTHASQVQVDNPDSGARTHSRDLARCPRNSGNCWGVNGVEVLLRGERGEGGCGFVRGWWERMVVMMMVVVVSE